VWNFFVGHVSPKQANARASRSARRDDSDKEQPDDVDDYDDLLFTIGAIAVVIAFPSGAAVWYCLLGKPLTAGHPPPGLGTRIIGALLGAAAFFASLAAALARVAQVFELWSERAAQIAVRNAPRWRLIAWGPAAISSGTAWVAGAVAVGAAVLAAMYGWTEFAGEIADRAHFARSRAAGNGATARAAVRAKR
jgi:hypothetical protein